MSHEHDHQHDDLALRAAALEAVLVEKGLLTTDQIDAIVERYERVDLVGREQALLDEHRLERRRAECQLVVVVIVIVAHARSR